jgi:signal transduction histidine kinase
VRVNLGLKTKLLLILLVLSVLSLSSLSFVYMTSEAQLIRQVTTYTNNLSRAIQVSVERLTQGGAVDSDALQKYVPEIRSKGIEEVSVVSTPDEEIIASTNPRHVGKKAAPEPELIVKATLGENVGGETKKRYNVILPIVVGDEEIGYVHIVMLLDDFRALIRSNNAKRIAATVVVFALGAVAALYLATRYTRPISQVVQAARRVADGDLSQTLPETRNDEVGQLIRSFNEMVVKLRHNRRLEEKLHEAERLSAVGQLASGIAHEIRNPLNFINLTIDHLRARMEKGAADPSGADAALLGQMKEEIVRLNTMVSNFLTFGRPGRLVKQRGDVNAVVAGLTALIEARAGAQSVEIVLSLDPGARPIPFDPDAIRTALTNVMANALQAMPEGGRLQISTGPVEEGAAVTISDTGGGISPENIDKVFEPYFTTKETGIGLGLALTRKILMEHGGNISIDSTPGRGTTVRIVIPEGEPESASSTPPPPEPVAHAVDSRR